MSLVNGDEAHLDVRQFCLEQFRAYALGRNVEYLRMTEHAVLECLYNFLATHTRVDGCGEHLALSQIVYLVFHQGYERRDDDAHAFHGESRHLECERFAAARRHQSQCVLAIGDAAYDVALYAAEIGVAPSVSQYLEI